MRHTYRIMMQFTFRLAMAILIVGAVAWIGRTVAPAAALAPASAPAVVRIEPAAQQVITGGIITATIEISQVENLYGADARLTFDPAVLAVVDADAGQAGAQIVPGPLLTNQGSGMIFINQAVNATGSITYVSFLLNPAVPFSGTSALAYVRFVALAPGPSALAFSYVELSSNTGGILPHATEHGQIVVIGVAPRAFFPTVVR